MQSNLLVEECSVAHASIMAALHERCFDAAWSVTAFRELFASPGVIGLICQKAVKEPTGFVLGRIAADEAEILTLGVLPQWRRQGVAVYLLQQITERVRVSGVNKLFLEVSEANEAAIQLYTQEKFLPIGRRENYYKLSSGRADALMFAKAILA